jgi:hypothetical protein
VTALGDPSTELSPASAIDPPWTAPSRHDPQWTVPAQARRPGSMLPGSVAAPGGRGPIRAGRVWASAGLVIVAHVVSVAVVVVLAAIGTGPLLALLVGAVAQAVLLVVVVAVGVPLVAAGERGFGLGLLIGWGVGIVVLPVLGCLAVAL